MPSKLIIPHELLNNQAVRSREKRHYNFAVNSLRINTKCWFLEKCKTKKFLLTVIMYNCLQ